jgi:hypothetical protein
MKRPPRKQGCKHNLAILAIKTRTHTIIVCSLCRTVIARHPNATSAEILEWAGLQGQKPKKTTRYIS